MGCEIIGNAIVCSRGKRRQLCAVGLCGKPSVALCDYPITRKGTAATCDSPMCERHRYSVPGEIDKNWCYGHFIHEQWRDVRVKDRS
jgi:hypothetical protein